MSQPEWVTDMRHEPIAMPPWLLTLNRVLWQTLPTARAAALRQQLDAQCLRLEGRVPFRLVHLWQAEVVVPLLGEALPKHRQALLALQSLHQRAALGLLGRQGEWRMTLKPVLLALYRQAYAYEAAYVQAHESAMNYGLAAANSAMIVEQFGDAQAFANYYAQLNSKANASAFAQAHAVANAEITARAYAGNDALAYAAVCAASARVYAWACGQTGEQRRSLFNALAEGVIRCLETLPFDSTGERDE